MSIGIDEVTGSDSTGWDGSGTEFGCALVHYGWCTSDGSSQRKSRFVTVSGDNRNNFYRAPRVRLVHQHRVASPFQQ